MLGTLRWRALVAVGAIGITLASPVAPPARAASEGAQAEAEADELIRQALDMRRSGDDQGARPLFVRAHDSSPSPRTAAQLGFCEQALGLWTDAEVHVSEALHAPQDAWVRKHRDAIDHALVLIKAHIARVEITGEPTGAEIFVNGDIVGHLPLDGPVRLSAGDVEFELRAPGYQTVSKRLDLRGGQYHRIVLRAEALPAPVSLPAPVPGAVSPVVAATPGPAAVSTARAGDDGASAAEGSGPLRRSLKFISWGTAIGSAAFALYGFNDKRERIEEFNSGCGVDPTGKAVSAADAPPGFSDQRCDSLRNRFQWSSTAAWVGVGASAALTVGGFAVDDRIGAEAATGGAGRVLAQPGCRSFDGRLRRSFLGHRRCPTHLAVGPSAILAFKRATKAMDIIELENAIPKPYQDQVEEELGSNRMLWTLAEEVARSSSGFATSYPGFGHMAYLADPEEPLISPMSSLLLPILFVFCEKAGIPYNALIRIRVGLFTRTITDAKHHNPHVDYGEPHRTAVYYVNDCDGDTFLFDQTFDDVSVEDSGRYANANRFTLSRSIAPQKGKMICFDGRHYHASSYPTKASKRIAITYNFV